MLGTQCKMAATEVDRAVYEETLLDGTRRAQTLLDKLQFNEAQSVFHQVLHLAAQVSRLLTTTTISLSLSLSLSDVDSLQPSR